jgi:PAS domain S-box-containing protein
MIQDQAKTKSQLIHDLTGLRQHVTMLEAAETECLKAQEAALDQAQSLAAIGEFAIKLAAAPAHDDLWELIAESLKSITAALAVAVFAYEPETQELVAKHIAASGRFLSAMNKHLGRNVVGFRVPVSPEMKRRMLAEVSRTVEDMTDASMGTVAPSVAAALQSALGIGHYASLALQYGGELMGTAMMIMPQNRPAPSTDLLKTFAHLAAVSLRRKQAEDALRENEELYRMLIETSPDGIMHMDLDAKILTANKALARLSGRDSAEELIGRNGLEFVAAEDRQTASDQFNAFLTTGVLSQREYRVMHKDGSTFPAEISTSLVVDAHHKPKTMIGIVRDISARKHLQEAMEQRARELDMLNRAGQALNASLDLTQALATTLETTCCLLQVDACSIWLIDPETGELVCHDATGSHQHIVRGWRLAPGEGLAGWIAQAGESLIVPDAQLDARHYTGVEQETGLVMRSILGTPLRVKEKIIGVIEVLDVEVNRFSATHQALLESVVVSAAIALENARLYKALEQRMEELERTQAQLVESAKMAAVGELAAGVAHELNNPLTAILGFSDLLLERAALDDPNRPRLKAIARQASRVRDIVANLLSFSRQTEFHREPTSPNQVLQETLALIRLRLKARGVAIREHLVADLPDLALDAGRMKQVFLNLITNALDAMPGGGTLTIRSEQVGAEVAVHLSDTGEGIAPQHLPHIFEPFFSTKPLGNRSGLGLSVSLGIVQDHGGRIEVETQVPGGSTFTVWLPVQ